MSSQVRDIDFLPVQYHQRHARRQSQPWRIIVVLTFAVLLAAAAYSQHYGEQQAQRELAAIIPQHELAVAQNGRLAEIQSRLQTARARAELLTYLRHPWPRTQLLAALLAPLPDEITLKQLQILRETPGQQAFTERRSRSERNLDEEEDKKLSPAARDLKRLREKYDKLETLVLISGTTSDSAALQEYLGKLGNANLFAKADLDSETRKSDGGGLLEFSAIVVVRPGYGQPNGPTGPEKDAVAHTDTSPIRKIPR